MTTAGIDAAVLAALEEIEHWAQLYQVAQLVPEEVRIPDVSLSLARLTNKGEIERHQNGFQWRIKQ